MDQHEGDARADLGAMRDDMGRHVGLHVAMRDDMGQHVGQCEGGHGISMEGNARVDWGAMQDDMRGS